MSKEAKQQLLDDYAFVFGTPEGKRVLSDLMNKCGCMTPNYDGSVNELLFREGERNVALYILSHLKYTIKDYIWG